MNAFILESHAKSIDHASRGCLKRDYLKFRIELAIQLIGDYHSSKRAGRKQSEASAQLERLNPTLGLFPVQAEKKLECIVCITKRQKKGLTRKEFRHESIIKCSHCDVHLCVHKDRVSKTITHLFANRIIIV